MEVFNVSPEAIDFIHKLYKTNKKKIEEDIEILKQWIKQQPHFPPITERNPHLFEISLIINKFNVEKVKTHIENHVTSRTVYKDIFEIIARPDLSPPSTLPLGSVPLPLQGPQFERLVVLWIKNSNACTSEDFIKSVMVSQELATKYEYSNGCRLLFDCKNVSFNLVKTMDFIKLRRLLALGLKGYKMKILGVHLVNAPSYIHIAISAFKILLKEKIIQRIVIHENFESLHEIVPRKYLPEEFGGTGGTLTEVLARFDALFESNREYLRTADQYGSNESLRIGKLTEDYTFGVEGTFKKLELD